MNVVASFLTCPSVSSKGFDRVLQLANASTRRQRVLSFVQNLPRSVLNLQVFNP